MRRTWLMLVALLPAGCSGGGAAKPTTVPTSTATDLPSDTSAATAEEADAGGSGTVSMPELEDVAAPVWTPATRTEELRDELVDASGPTVQMAINALDVEVGGVPGAMPSDLPPGEGVGDATLSELLGSVRDELVGEQATFVDAFLGEPTIAGTILPDGTVQLAATSASTTSTTATATDSTGDSATTTAPPSTSPRPTRSSPPSSSPAPPTRSRST